MVMSINLFAQKVNHTEIFKDNNAIITVNLIQDVYYENYDNKNAKETLEFISDGDGTVYTFDSLSTIPTSGVEKLFSNSFIVNTSFTISNGDILKINNNDTIILSNGVTINIEGYADFTPSDTALVTRSDASANPKGIYIKGDNSRATIQNMRFEYAGIKSSSPIGIEIRNCTFTLVNTKLSSSAINLLNGNNVIENCIFISNQSSAVASGSNVSCSLSFKYNYLYDNNTNNTNRPQINMGPSGDGTIEIVGNVIIGAQRSKVGGIGVANLLGVSGVNNVIISDNFVNNCRYGITTNGKMNALISNNQIIDNKYDPDPMTGGSGISIYDQNNIQNTMITGNHIEENLWGITIVSGGNVNIGKLCVDSTDSEFNPGLNVFVNNGNNGMLYDLYNNSSNTIYAQGNTWNVEVQDSVSIEEVIYHKNDDPNLGEVIFMYHPDNVYTDDFYNSEFNYFINNNKIYFYDQIPSNINIYNINGSIVYSINNNTNNIISLENIMPGIYILNILSNNKEYNSKIIIN